MNRLFARVVPVLALAWLMILGTAARGDRPGTVVLDAPWFMQDVAQIKDTSEVISSAAFSPKIYQTKPYVKPDAPATAPTSPDWYKATVPGTVLTTLVNNNVYPDPLFGENNRPDIIPDSLCRTSYWYRTQTKVPAEFAGAGKKIWLNFEGINYIADVWVNGKQAGTIKGAFTRGTFDITDLVKAGENATVGVMIHPPPNPNTPNEHTIAAGVGRNGGILTGDGPTFLASQGWNWMPGIRDRNMGIWQGVRMYATDAVVLENPFVSAAVKLSGPGKAESADLTLTVTLRNTSDVPVSGQLLLGIRVDGTRDNAPLTDFGAPVTLAAKEVRTLVLTPAEARALAMPNPRLWWPNNYGLPNLYVMHLRFEEDIENRKIGSDAQDMTFGIRDVKYTIDGSQNLALTVNGVPIMAEGGNWGMDEAMKRIPRSRLEAQVRLHKEANFNMIRNWVGQSTSEDFYDLCDRYGLMVWDEFWQPNPSDGPNPADAGLYLSNVREKVLRFRNHPSIVLWCARNEGNPPANIDAGIKQIMKELEPQRLYQANSADGRGVRSGGLYRWRAPREYYVYPDAEAFKTELGLGVSMPTLEAVKAMIPEKDWETINDDWANHNFTRGTQGGERYVQDISPRYGTANNLADFVRRAQMANYESARALFEGRQAKMFKPVTGVLDWMSNPAFTSFTYQLYSHDLEPDASLFGARHACEPVHLQFNQGADQAGAAGKGLHHLMVINHTTAALADYVANVRVINMDGTVKSEKKIAVAAPACAATDLGAMESPGDLSAVHFIKLELRDGTGKVVSEGFYWRASAEPQDDLTPLLNMPAVALEAQALRHDADGKLLLDVTLKNPSAKNVALQTHVQLRNRKTGERILPVYYSDNYVSLLGGESRVITMEAAAKDLGRDDALVVVDGWNVTLKEPVMAPGVAVEVNAEASRTQAKP